MVWALGPWGLYQFYQHFRMLKGGGDFGGLGFQSFVALGL